MESMFQKKYDEFVEDLLGALPEYTAQIQEAKGLDHTKRLEQFQESVKIEFDNNPVILPGLTI